MIWDNPEETGLVQAIEALLFASDGPLSVERMKEVLDDQADLRAIRAACQALRLEYDQLGRAFELVEVAGGFQFRTRARFGPLVAQLRKTAPLRLSRAALETLAIVAYKQPVLRAEVERIRGVDCGGVLKALLERGLTRIVGRENLPGRPLTYGTTRRFLEVFELKNLDSLPSLEELALDQGLDGFKPREQAELFPDDVSQRARLVVETAGQSESQEDRPPAETQSDGQVAEDSGPGRS
ncbi:MAG: SMC-Scp complex subunit ScpB [Deltaproteobacteria bacterium]|nr:SMC-Scp complex subunit ScpB [Deltaproteobacteria bacterium]